MNKILFYIISVGACFISCNDKSENSSIIIEDKASLVTQMADMYFMDSYIARASKSEKDSVRKKLQNEFFQLHNITVDELDKYLVNLKNDKKLFGELMDSVSVVLTAKTKNKKAQ